MESQHHKIDEIFRQRLHDAEAPPPPFVWPALEQELRKRRRRMALWIFTGSCMIAMAAAGLIWMRYRSDQTNPSKASEVTSIQAPQLECATSMYAAKNKPAPVAAPSKERTPKATHSEFSPAISSKGAPAFSNVSVLAQETTPAVQTSGPTADAMEATSPISQITLADLPLPSVAPASFAQGKSLSPKTFKATGRSKKVVPRLCYDFDRHPSAWLIDVYAGPSFAQSSLTSRLEDRPYLNQRLATENPLIAMNVGVRASLMFNRNLLVRTGLHYNRITEEFEYIDPTYVKYHIVATVVNGTTQIDTVGVEYGEHYQKVYNRYSTLDVPLMAGVEMRRGRSGVSINAGASVNIWFQKRGTIIDPATGKPARFDNNGALEGKVFRNGIGLSACASIQWYYHLGPHLRVFAEPSFRQILRPVSLKSHPVEHRYSILGIKLGATKIF
ncbi:MAG: hypothetical protein SFV22_12400 [Saprospiraceae bacterium]|nr:hypothetical protein [Saprospiraceae bacterium]